MLRLLRRFDAWSSSHRGWASYITLVVFWLALIFVEIIRPPIRWAPWTTAFVLGYTIASIVWSDSLKK